VRSNCEEKIPQYWPTAYRKLNMRSRKPLLATWPHHNRLANTGEITRWPPKWQETIINYSRYQLRVVMRPCRHLFLAYGEQLALALASVLNTTAWLALVNVPYLFMSSNSNLRGRTVTLAVVWPKASTPDTVTWNVYNPSFRWLNFKVPSFIPSLMESLSPSVFSGCDKSFQLYV